MRRSGSPARHDAGARRRIPRRLSHLGFPVYMTARSAIPALPLKIGCTPWHQPDGPPAMSTNHAESGAVRSGARLRFVSSSGFVIDATTSADDGVLREFYSDYDRAFVLENEKEGYDGFAECLRLNHGDAYADLVKRYGPFREFVLVVREAKTKARLGGANFIIFPISPASKRGVVLSMNLNYVFVNPEARQKGVFRRLMGDMPNIAYRLFARSNSSDLPEKWRAKEQES